MDRRSFLKILSAVPFLGAIPNIMNLAPSRLEILKSISSRIGSSVNWVIGKKLVWYRGYYPGVR